MKKQYRKPKQIRAYFTMMKYFFLAQTRNPATFAFGFIFPVVFISIFGLIGNSPLKLTVGVPGEINRSNPVISAIAKQSFVKIDQEDNQVLENKLKQGKLSGIVNIQMTSQTPPKYTVKLTTSIGNPQEGASLNSL